MARRFASSVFTVCFVFMMAVPAIAGGRLAEPSRFAPSTDGHLVQGTNPVTGEGLAVWTYRNGAETDIAIQSLGKADGLAGELILIGQDDGIDQVRPALAFDPNGSVYISFVERSSGVVKLSALAAGSTHWTRPQGIAVGVASDVTASLQVVGNRLVVAYVVDGAVTIRHFKRIAPAHGDTQKLGDGPDPVLSSEHSFPSEDEPKIGDATDTMDDPEEAVDVMLGSH